MAISVNAEGNHEPRPANVLRLPALLGWLDPTRWSNPRRRRKALKRITQYIALFRDNPELLRKMIEKELDKLEE